MTEKEKNDKEDKKKKNRFSGGWKWLEKGIHQHNMLALVGVALILFAVTTATAALIPMVSIYDVPPSYRAHEYTPLEQEGRGLYMSLGCFYCHSQQSREWDWVGYNLSLVGDYAYDSPHALGTERSGPDLSQIGGHRPTIWHRLHDTDPRQVSPNSIMPNFGFLTDSQLEALVAYIQSQGTNDLTPYNWQPQVPEEYLNISNPYGPLMMEVASDTQWNETAEAYVYTGPDDVGQQWAEIFDAGKALYTQKCLSCHGCSGNGMGPYARTAVTRPADLHERISRYPGDFFHYWRVSGGVPGTYMPDWGKVLNDTEIFYIMTYEMSFADQIGHRAIRTISGDISDAEGDSFNNQTNPSPVIDGSSFDFYRGQGIYTLYCAQCHGDSGQGDGPASNETRYGYIQPVPANFTESGGDFPEGDYGRWVWKVTEGVETTNMPPWKWALNDTEIAQVIFYEQSFSNPDDYNSKWAPLYSDSFAKNLMSTLNKGSFGTPNIDPVIMPAGILVIMFALILGYKHFSLGYSINNGRKKPIEKLLKWRCKIWV